MDKTCNGGYCNYKLLGGSNPLCSYQGYCDYQCPKDSRGYEVKPTITPQELARFHREIEINEQQKLGKEEK